jgi:hypothetical protein
MKAVVTLLGPDYETDSTKAVAKAMALDCETDSRLASWLYWVLG